MQEEHSNSQLHLPQTFFKQMENVSPFLHSKVHFNHCSKWRGTECSSDIRTNIHLETYERENDRFHILEQKGKKKIRKSHTEKFV